MFDSTVAVDRSADGAASVLTSADLASIASALGRLDEYVDDAERVEQIRRLEELKSAAAAAQAQVTAAFVVSQEADQAAAGARPAEVGKGIAAQVGLAKRESPARARRYTGWAKILTGELPHTLAALRYGEITEWRAMLVARETAWLSASHRAQVDAELAGRLGEYGDRRVEAEARQTAYRLDPHGAAARSSQAQSDRRVSLRPAPETMSVLSALLPVAQGVAVHTSLRQHADSLRAAGDPRGRGQIMADTLVERATGQATAGAVQVEVDLVITDRTLFGGDDEPAHLDGHGPIPAPLARRLVRGAEETTKVWLRRLYARPATGELVTMDSHRRLFEHGLRKFLVIRDRYCRTPWCDAPIRHADHPIPAEVGGSTSAANGQGLCEACNHAKQAARWKARPGPNGAGHSVVTTTPTGRTYTSRPPHPPDSQPRRAMTTNAPSRIEALFREHVLAA